MNKNTALLAILILFLFAPGCHNNAAPVIPSAPVGPDIGMVGETLKFAVVTTDPNSDSIRYRMDWGDDVGDWSSLLASAETCTLAHAWALRDTFSVKVQAEDVHGLVSDWSPAHEVSIESICRR
jgi:hypothetical protein